MLRIVSGFVCLILASAHICLLDPAQRGGFNVYEPGEHVCFRPQGPCGGPKAPPPEQPVVNLVGGSTYSVTFQQNLNHYNPGNPGYMDVAFSVGVDQTSDDNFTVIAKVPDYYAHLQAQQTNFTVTVLVPNIDCEHCTLRIRYHPNKPTEPNFFHNCADVSISKSPIRVPSAWGRIFALGTIGDKTSIRTTQVLEVLATGELDAPLPMPSHANGEPLYLVDGLVAADHRSQSIFFLVDSYEVITSDKSIPNKLARLDVAKGAWGQVVEMERPVDIQWNAILSTGDLVAPLLLIGQRKVNDSDFFAYTLHTVDPVTGKTSKLAESEPEQTYVNFLWSVADYERGLVYVLGGDENSVTDLNAVLITFDIKSGVAKTVQQNNTEYTLSSLYLDSASGHLLAVSPGLFLSDHAWSLVRVDPSNGVVSPIAKNILPAGTYDAYYGGGVQNGISVDGKLLHVLHRSFDEAQILFLFNRQTGSIDSFTVLPEGVDREIEIRNLVFLGPTH